MARISTIGLATAILLFPAIASAGTMIAEMRVSTMIVGEPEYAVGYLVPVGSPPDAEPITAANFAPAPDLSPAPMPAPR
jgi:hypothetical protein